jgi:hypothetical protein
LVIVGAVLAGLLILIVLLRRRHSDLTAAELVRDRHGRLIRWGGRLGYPLGQGQTIREYGQALGQTLKARGQGARLSRTQQAGAVVPAEIETLVQAVEQAQYSAQAISERKAGQVRALWARLRRHLWWLWLVPSSKTDEIDSAQAKHRHEP